ncbi:hypothetical protein HCEG_05509 [Histoplasma capsulatum var. duboisii H88]|uniref:Uncharacterized protein n=2 Tax=Ajellomyces capsulatus TaxID=5037 RepID=F0UHT5_AJEC8|nr:hypothetical protein HCDG_03259 [Histoplasma capsulatum H143]EGC46294.1 hypothetical protein HCEG_05509 [Histoplasma capsulatum var. duboisii H88]
MATEKREKLEAQIKSADMSEDMQQEAIEVATEAMDKYHIEKDIAQYIKKEKPSILYIFTWDTAPFCSSKLNK